ncbi:STAS domain-containing protein [Dactylosporangium cerinum]|uniref:Anti-sigma factor antagonist n=1 Tax=Dactylosporangium cerinum TaxID=1434730 RepID=A0ABV9W2G9_9ACTN
MALSLSTTRDAGMITVTVAGAVDLSTVAELDQAVLAAIDAGPPSVVVDLAAVTFIDSAGINTLLKSRRLADERGQHFRITNPTGIVRDVLDLTGVLIHLSG